LPRIGWLAARRRQLGRYEGAQCIRNATRAADGPRKILMLDRNELERIVGGDYGVPEVRQSRLVARLPEISSYDFDDLVRTRVDQHDLVLDNEEPVGPNDAYFLHDHVLEGA
jgi:hypothetical protein